MDSKNLHSNLYYKLRGQIETTWPQWKIDAANDLIVGKNSNFLTKRKKMTCYREGGCGPYENRSCYECPVKDLNMVIKNNSCLASPFSFQINPVKIEGTLMFFCEPQEQPLFSEALCSITFTGKASDIINIIKNMEIS